ncbi:matrixin family metalloprotease, partial [bacterium]
GVYTLQAVFTGLPDGQGSTVATASGQVTVTGSGVLNESIAADGKVASIALAPDTSPNLYPVVSNLGLTVRDAENRILAVRGDAASLIAGTEGSLLPFGNGYTVLFEGDMTLRASTDGVQSNSVTVRSQKSVSSGGVVTPNYADEVQLARWERMPLTIRFDRSGAYRFDLETRFREAMNDWTSRTKNEVRFVETNSASADLAVSFVTQASLGGDTVGLTSFTYRDTSEGRIHTKATLKISSDYGNTGQIRAICAHELGHALGIEGHSQEQDLMYFRIGGIYNQRDVNTLRTAYREDFSLTRSIPSEGPEKQATISCPK